MFVYLTLPEDGSNMSPYVYKYPWRGVLVQSLPGGGVLLLVQSLSGDVQLKRVTKAASHYINDPLFSAKTGIMGRTFKIFLNKLNFINLIPKFA